MTQVHTQYGPGEIVAEDIVRGRRQYKVAGNGFSIWLPQEQIREAAAPVDFDNSVSLPWSVGKPQHPAIPGATESTQQPNHKVDADKLLTPSDSVTGKPRTESEGGPWPKPNPALFAASRYYYGAEDEEPDEADEPSEDSGGDDADSAPDFGGSDDGPPSDVGEDSGDDDGSDTSSYNFGPSDDDSDSDDDDDSPADDSDSGSDDDSDSEDQGDGGDEIPEDYLEHPLIELVQEAQAMLQEHPDWAQRPVGEIIDHLDSGGGQEQGPPEQGPPEQGGLPPGLEGGPGGPPPGLSGGGPSPEEIGAKLSMILGRALYYSDTDRNMAMIRHASNLHQAGFEREAWGALPGLITRALPYVMKALPSLGIGYAGHQIGDALEGDGGGGLADNFKEMAAENVPAIGALQGLLGGGGGGSQGIPAEYQDALSGLNGGDVDFQQDLEPPVMGSTGPQRTSAFNERLAWGQIGLKALQLLGPMLTKMGPKAERAIQMYGPKAMGLLKRVGPQAAGTAAGHALGGGGGGQQQPDASGRGNIDPKNPLPLWNLGGGGWGDLTSLKASVQRPAGLSDRYIDITSSADYHNDPVVQFRHDPDAYISRIGHVQDEGLNPRFAEYVALVEGDKHIREAAWSDVRTKALRLRREGHVHVKDVGPDRIYATVQGDHGIYDTMIKKGGSFGGLGGGHGITNWHCGCEWGKWAFKRRYTYVGRLCSHGYAAYLEMQSQHTKGQPRMKRQTKPPRRTKKSGADDRLRTHSLGRSPLDASDYEGQADEGRALWERNNAENPSDTDRLKKYYRLHRADALQMVPTRLVPELAVNDTDDAVQRHVDVTKDERTTTGPEGIMSDREIKHFTSMLARCEQTGTAYPRELVAYLVKRAAPYDPYGDAGDAGEVDEGEPYDPYGGAGAAGGRTNLPPALQTEWVQGSDGKMYPSAIYGPSGLNSIPGDDPNREGDWAAPGVADTKDRESVMGTGDREDRGRDNFTPEYMQERQQQYEKNKGSYGYGDQPANAQAVDSQGHTTSDSQTQTAGPGQDIPAGSQAAHRGVSWDEFDPGGTGGGLGGAGMQADNKDWRRSTETTGISGDKYTVKPGEIGQDIANRAGVDVSTLKAPSGNINDLKPGDVLDTSHKTDKAQSQSGARPTVAPTGNPIPTKNGVPIDISPLGIGSSSGSVKSKDPALAEVGKGSAPALSDFKSLETGAAGPPKKEGHRKLEAYFSQYYGTPVRYAAAPSPGTRRLEAYFSQYYGRPITAAPAEEEEGEQTDPLVPGDQDGSPKTGNPGTDVLDPSGTSDGAKASSPVAGVNSLGTATADVKGTAEADAQDKADKEAEEKEQDKQVDIGKTDPTSLVNQGPTGNNLDVGQMGGGGMGDISGITNMIGDIGSAVAPAIGAGIGMIPDIASGVGGALSGISGLMSGLGGILGSKQEMFGYKLAAEDFGYPELQPHQPFNGSGPQPPLTIHPSKEHMDGIDYEDVTDLGDYDIYKRKAAARWFEADDNGTAQGTTSGQDTGGQGQGLRDPSTNSFNSTPGVAPAAPTAANTPNSLQSGAASGAPAAPVAPLTPGTQPLLQASFRYAEIDGPEDWEASDATDANSELEKLRNWAEDNQEEFYGEMDQHIDDVQDTVQRAHEYGVDASPLVASRVKRAGKPRQRPPVEPELVRVYGGNGAGRTQTVAHVDDRDPYSKTAADFDADDGGGDVVARFQRSAAAQEMLGSSGGGGDDYDISGAASSFLKTAGRNYSIAEQHELMNEKHPKGARNLASLDLEGTHYEAENSVGLW